MVYVFYVQPGSMITLDDEISIMDSILHLQEIIEQRCEIPVDHQVLLVSGGQPLIHDKKICSYMTGTDTNPIYLFNSKYDFKKMSLPTLQLHDDMQLEKRLMDALTLPPALDTVDIRTQLVKECYRIAQEQLKFCEALVSDQHLQQQGWFAVIANLEDILKEFRKRWETFRNVYQRFKEDCDESAITFEQFQKDKELLQRIPLLHILLDLGATVNVTPEEEEKQPADVDDPQSSQKDETNDDGSGDYKQMSLLEYIASKDTRNSLDEHHEFCLKGLQKYSNEIVPSLQNGVEYGFAEASKVNKREIDGLEKRLFDLDQQLQKVKKNVQLLGDMAQSFSKNQQGVSNLKDKSILPDLCATHQQQLKYVITHYEQLIEDRNRIIKAKYELSKSLCGRLRWVQTVENIISNLDSNLVYYHEQHVRLRKYFELFVQIHTAPKLYLNAVAEVVRRRAFTQSFMSWASDIACQHFAIYNEEMARRKEFASEFSGHFLQTLFPGMSDLPPPFATQAPDAFDDHLPHITDADVATLRSQVPDLADNLTILNQSSAINFFKTAGSSSGSAGTEVKSEAANKQEGEVDDKGVVTALPVALLKDLDRGCESETDTEEFEKVCQSPTEYRELPTEPIPIPSTQDVSTSTTDVNEDNLQVSRSEHEQLKSSYVAVTEAVKIVVSQLRGDLDDVKNQVISNRHNLSTQCESLSTSWDDCVNLLDTHGKQMLDSVRKEHETEVSTWRAKNEEKSSAIEKLHEEKLELENQLTRSCDELHLLKENFGKEKEHILVEMDHLRDELVRTELQYQKSIKELADKLKSEHKSEIDNIKSRFKFMTMERSASTQSLEKSGDFSSSHASLITQITDNFELDKQKAIEDVRKEDKEIYERLLAQKVEELELRFTQEKDFLTQQVAKIVSDDKDKQIDLLRDRVNNLSLECIKYKTTIQQLTESSNDSQHDSDELLDQIQQLKLEIGSLKEELGKRKAAENQMAGSFEGRIDVSTSPLKQTRIVDMTRSDTYAYTSASTSTPLNSVCVNLDSCKVGCFVLVLWDPIHESFKILQETKHLYFLHSDYLEGLGLSVTDGVPNKMHCRGEVIDREYCHARKSENRYKVPKGTKFFRVKVRPIPSAKDLFKSPSTSFSTSSKLLTARSISEETTTNLADEVDTTILPEPTSPLPFSVTATLDEKDEDNLMESEETLLCVSSSEKNEQTNQQHFAEDSGIVDNIVEISDNA